VRVRFRFFDVDGRTIEISSDVDVRQHRKVEEGEAIPVRISHAVMNSTDIEATRGFYEQHLGFRHSDTLWSNHMGELMHFMRCNDWHHSLAIANGPHTSVHHVSFEMRGLDEYMRGTGRVMRAGIKKVWGPGRHLAGNNTFSYFIDPSGNTMEYATELERLDEDVWHPHAYDVDDPLTQDQWGTADPMSELIAKESFNDVDRGVFVAPRSEVGTCEGSSARLPDVDLETWRRTFDINVTGPLLGIQALVPLMGPGASIVNVCSVAAMAGHAAAAYTASKWALRGLTRTASLELGARGIRVNAVMPGLVETPLMESASPAFRDAALAEIPLGRTGSTADIAPTMVFLVSDESAYYNGAELVIDGGMSAHVSHKGIADATRPTR
jgi:NAD(P)-dependent dehydrogenase (short-subunit alcohol dehydrogenase family)/catechol 2,3-dioxygenase-like lactoylglutathione lyase family enzyme